MLPGKIVCFRSMNDAYLFLDDSRNGVMCVHSYTMMYKHTLGHQICTPDTVALWQLTCSTSYKLNFNSVE